MTESLDDLRAAVTRNKGVRYGIRYIEAQSDLIEALEAENARVQQQNDGLHQAVLMGSREQETLRAEIEMHMDDRRAMRVENEQLAARIELLIERRDEIAALSTEAHAEVAALQGKVECTGDHDDLIRDNERLREQVRELEAQAKIMKNLWATDQKLVRGLEDQAAAWFEREGLCSQIDALRTELHEQQELLAAADKDHLEMLAVLRALEPFWGQCQRGETENPQRYQETYLALDAEIRKWAGVRRSQ